MGCCATKDTSGSKSANKEIDDDLNMYASEDEKTYKLLLLGAGESGKSTILKQIQKIQDES